MHVVLHGGEPLLAGAALLRRAAEDAAPRPSPPDCALDLRIHTNGVRLDRAYCELFAELGVKVGISLDGDRAANDRHRRYADGRSSHGQVLAAVELLRTPEYRHLYAGLLCTVDVANDPVAVYDALVALEPAPDRLPAAARDLGHPATPNAGAGPPEPTPYADWLQAVYDRWTAHGRPVPMRLFDSVHRTLRGRSSLTESLGLDPADLVVIETDGTLEQADSLKTAYDGAAGTGLRVQEHPFSAAAEDIQVRARQSGVDALSAQCRSCPVLLSCGGGLLAHRYRAENIDPADPVAAFRNPTVYCADIYTLIRSIACAEARPETAPPASRSAPGLSKSSPPASVTRRRSRSSRRLRPASTAHSSRPPDRRSPHGRRMPRGRGN